jgi:hypothetical protein
LEVEFRKQVQGDMDITQYTGRLKQLADALRDVGQPVSETSQVLNLLRSLNSKYRHAIPVMTAKQLPHTILFARSYLLLEEHYDKEHAKRPLTTLSWPPVALILPLLLATTAPAAPTPLLGYLWPAKPLTTTASPRRMATVVVMVAVMAVSATQQHCTTSSRRQLEPRREPVDRYGTSLAFRVPGAGVLGPRLGIPSH